MSKLLVSIACFLLGAMAIPQVAAARESNKDCNRVWTIECELVLHGVSRKVIPVNDLVCIDVIQPRRSNVLLLVLFPGEREPRPYVKSIGEKGSFCIWRGWAKQAEAMYLCNERDGSEYFSRADTAQIAVKAKNIAKPGACLYGEKKCEAKGYQPLRDLAPEERFRIDLLRSRAQLWRSRQ